MFCISTFGPGRATAGESLARPGDGRPVVSARGAAPQRLPCNKDPGTPRGPQYQLEIGAILRILDRFSLKNQNTTDLLAIYFPRVSYLIAVIGGPPPPVRYVVWWRSILSGQGAYPLTPVPRSHTTASSSGSHVAPPCASRMVLPPATSSSSTSSNPSRPRTPLHRAWAKEIVF